MITPAIAEAVNAIRFTVPLDIVALVQAVFTGIAALGGVFATVYAIYAKRSADVATAEIAKVKDNVVLIERNTNSLTKELAALAKKEGEQIGKDRQIAKEKADAATLAEGQRQGAQTERANPSPDGTKT